jgi:hypothetical protein
MSTKEERMAELQAQMDALAQEEDDDDFEIEIYSSDGNGARLPYRKGKSWIQRTFGIDADTLSKPDADGKAGKTGRSAAKGDSDSDADATGGNEGGSNLKFLRQNRQRQGGQAS